jgi:hypothetical protein
MIQEGSLKKEGKIDSNDMYKNVTGKTIKTPV